MWITWILFIVIAYIWKILIFSWLPGLTEFVKIQQKYFTLIIAYFNLNVDFLFLYQLFCQNYLHNIYF